MPEEKYGGGPSKRLRPNPPEALPVAVSLEPPLGQAITGGKVPRRIRLALLTTRNEEKESPRCHVCTFSPAPCRAVSARLFSHFLPHLQPGPPWPMSARRS